ncbi:MAG: glycerol-3-phosphate acyltransferase [Candidatus Thorarchaeota archaeon]
MIGLKILYLVLSCLGGYLLGSIPFSVWTGKLFFGMDVREHNVRNAGGMNAALTFGPAIGITVLFLDFLKGTVTIALIDHLFSMDYFISESGINIWHTLACFLGPFFCVIGHSYSVFLKFDGGQGLGVFTGVSLYLNPFLLVFYDVFIISVMLTKKINVRVATLIALLLEAVLIMFIPISPPWNLMEANRFLWEPDFLEVKLGLLVFIMGMGMLIRMIHSILKKSKSSTWKITDKIEQKFDAEG